MDTVVEVGKRVVVEGPIASHPPAETPPASMVVTRTIQPGVESAEAWDAWVAEMRRLASMYSGFIGLDEMPSRDGSRQRTILYSFATPAQLEAWLDSPTRAEWITKLDRILMGPSVEQQVNGLDSLHRHAAPKWKESMAILAAGIPVGRGVEWAITHSAVGSYPLAVRIVGSAMLGVLVMTYLAVPTSFRVFRNWLHR